MKTRNSTLKTIALFLFFVAVGAGLTCACVDCDCEEASTLRQGTYPLSPLECGGSATVPVMNDGTVTVARDRVTITFESSNIDWTLTYDII